MAVMNDTGRSGRVPWRGLLFNVAFYGWTILLLPVGAVACAISPAAVWAVNRTWSRGSLFLLAVIVGLRHRTRGRHHVPDGPVMYAVKHQSAWETVSINLFVRNPVFVVKQELTRIPLFGMMLTRSGMIPVDRDGGAATLRTMLVAARARVAEGRSIVIFPEGTRTPVGERQPYHPGVAALYSALAVPVVPVALNTGLFWPRRSPRLAAGTITLEFLPPIEPGLPRRAFAARLESAIENASDALVAEARGQG